MSKLIMIALVCSFSAIFGCASSVKEINQSIVQAPVTPLEQNVEPVEKFVLPPMGSPEFAALMKQLDKDRALLAFFKDLDGALIEIKGAVDGLNESLEKSGPPVPK